jgi:cytoskeletal protein CcmA (bactofilin family)
VANAEESTVVGESILIHGNVSGDEDLTVRGRIEGTITLTHALLVEATAVVKAEVQVKRCLVSGALVGNVVASESVEIASGGRMVGDITAPRVVIADGASFRGRIDMGEVEVEGERVALARPAPRPALRPAPRSLSAGGRDDEGKASLAEKAAAAVKPPAPPVPVAMGAVKRKVLVRRK